MDKKQIIIDGVDVSKCCWCDFEPDTDPYCRINDGEDLGCEDNSNCYFKQLARKTQECEELKRNNQILCDLYKNVDSCLQKRTEKFDCYRKALDEIKEVCKCNYHTPTLEEKELADDILDIISKVKGGDNEDII